MNAPLAINHHQVRAVNLADAQECARVDAYVLNNSCSTPFHLTAWINGVEAGTGQRAHMLIAQSARGMIEGVLPLHSISSPLFGRAMVSCGFAVGGGIIADSHTVVQQLADAAWELAKAENCPSVELRGGALPNGQWIIQGNAHANFARSLAPDDDAELLAIPRKQRAEVRKGLSNSLVIETGNAPRDLNWHYRVYAESVRNLGTPVFPKALMVQILYAFGDDADILTVLSNGVPVASVLSLYHKGAVMPFWGGGVRAARALRANDVMYYALMNHARRRGCSAFDFGRSKLGSGAFQFKKNWGFEPQPLSYAVRTAAGGTLRDINPNSPKYKAKIALWQKLPLPVANLIGPWIAKGLG
jgi:FemAB-related protein (PEP-CTERM system-associated)